MNNVFFTADLHFGHKNILKYNPETRPYLDLKDMEEKMIEQWNERVHCSDYVWILGDVSFYKSDKTVEILKRMNGTKLLIEGNHDKSLMKSNQFKECFMEIHQYRECKIGDHNMVLFHFPIFDWHRVHHGAIHLHGHVHGFPTGIRGKILDVGWDAHGNVLSYEEVVSMMETKEVRGHGVGKN